MDLRDYDRAVELAQADYDAGADWLGEIAIDPLLSPIRMDP